ncbi:MAG: ATPase [Alphaproteobacteria bacterium]|nr:ATPase [Alphaproteobacteria bacterium]MBV9372195.1 ATPase [Alphaproteobacteria bacterium]MBV9902326.1 ATPase [Alphaproteobacteria bacterium]
MAGPNSYRPLAGAAILLVAFGVALLSGELLLATLIGALGGALATITLSSATFMSVRRTAHQAQQNGLEEMAAEVIAPLDDPILLLRAGRILAANPAARALLGPWIEGQDVRLALRHPATVERLSRSAAPAAPVEQIEVAGIGHAERKWLVTIASISGEMRLVHLRDRSAALAAERMRVDFVANASHELRTPLATVLGFIETLADDSAGSDAEIRGRFLGLMHGEAKRMQQLIEDLMSLSRIEAERFSPPREPVDLVPLIDELRTACGQILLDRRNRLVVENLGSGTVVQGDRGQLLQLLRNLLVNAVKYGRPDSDVTVRIEDDGDGAVRITVSDRGGGIAAEHLPRLTERFYRVDAGRSRAVGGTGLGLAIVKHIVTRHKGSLDIRSTVGEGTSIRISLPRPEPVQPGP